VGITVFLVQLLSGVLFWPPIKELCWVYQYLI